jgi:L-fuculose-phosphate aldolase
MTSALPSALLQAARDLQATGLNKGTAGNVSVRDGTGFWITPTGMDYAQIDAGDMVFMDGAGTATGRRKPSSEWRFHRDIYAARPEAGAVIHTHAPFATSLACRGEAIPAFHYMVARFGGHEVRCARYATFGTQELSEAVIEALQGHCACLMGHHGMVLFGNDLQHALALAVEFEALCEQYWRVLTLGPAPVLPDDEMKRVVEKFADYGRQ